MIKQSFQVVAGALAFALWLFLMVSVPVIVSEMVHNSSDIARAILTQADE